MTQQAWTSGEDQSFPPIAPMGYLRIVLRGLPLALVTFGCLGLLLLLRLIERPIFGARRPWTPHLTMFVCQTAFRILGMGHVVEGTPMKGVGAAVANHSSWLDIFALNARDDVYFVAKSEVAGWPGIGWLARATGTLFVIRDRKHAKAQTEMLRDRLAMGHRLLFFPEGTSTDGRRVLPFKPTLFQSFLDPELPHDMSIQPITVTYHAPEGADARFYGWWGDTDFGTHLIHMLAAPRHGRVVITYHDAVDVAARPNRKQLALAMENTVRAGLTL